MEELHLFSDFSLDPLTYPEISTMSSPDDRALKGASILLATSLAIVIDGSLLKRLALGP